ncbi:flagellar hook-basal body complex protein FliE [Treponema sp. HNW]|uniref:flagellar hook-basal body complex protein FliE n=1 Tax=Treponema sp. HNW TaxID=3116654 RepID=UPI003D0ACB63
MIDTMNLVRSNPAHIGQGPMVNLGGKNDAGLSRENPGIANRTTFDRYLLDAVNYVNGKQLAVSDLARRAVTEPDSVDPHDVTIAMAQANLSLNLAQNVISRLTQAWNEITSGR